MKRALNKNNKQQQRTGMHTTVVVVVVVVVVSLVSSVSLFKGNAKPKVYRLTLQLPRRLAQLKLTGAFGRSREKEVLVQKSRGFFRVPDAVGTLSFQHGQCERGDTLTDALAQLVVRE